MRASSERSLIVKTGVVNTSRKQKSQVMGVTSGGGAPENACWEVANTMMAKYIPSGMRMENATT
jgi:hypothetical protein